ncbi:hypothetical protein FA09DRAFT_217588 [Tilletiopsis washingtonensis]|jgi:hypothetical protein|uniref:Uncharacterized protein n=1 Tax=Tilletiopsis washingtonensis TaxID=58919 RepID=A0A316ZDZ2_9BASI|nr:hypothetical protein FA09DRAFT_217588 [Tilletiopsis washingtonensis]PWN99749.1 hypothetical protein FA09DRAFT_217588 [Tilletiopsis washingtonensis]
MRKGQSKSGRLRLMRGFPSCPWAAEACRGGHSVRVSACQAATSRRSLASAASAVRAGSERRILQGASAEAAQPRQSWMLMDGPSDPLAGASDTQRRRPSNVAAAAFTPREVAREGLVCPESHTRGRDAASRRKGGRMLAVLRGALRPAERHAPVQWAGAFSRVGVSASAALRFIHAADATRVLDWPLRAGARPSMRCVPCRCSVRERGAGCGRQGERRQHARGARSGCSSGSAGCRGPQPAAAARARLGACGVLSAGSPRASGGTAPGLDSRLTQPQRGTSAAPASSQAGCRRPRRSARARTERAGTARLRLLHAARRGSCGATCSDAAPAPHPE